MRDLTPMPTEDDRSDLRAGTWGAAVVGGILVVGLLLHGQVLLAAVALPSVVIGIWISRIAVTGFMYPLASTAARIVSNAAGEELYTPRPGGSSGARRTRAPSASGQTPAYSVLTRCGCGAAIEVNASIPTETQRAMLTPFFQAHEPCAARVLAGERGVQPMTSTVTCCCGQQLTVDVVRTHREEMAQRADAFIAMHRRCTR
jgi:hypothetical protein